MNRIAYSFIFLLIVSSSLAENSAFDIKKCKLNISLGANYVLPFFKLVSNDSSFRKSFPIEQKYLTSRNFTFGFQYQNYILEYTSFENNGFCSFDYEMDLKAFQKYKNQDKFFVSHKELLRIHRVLLSKETSFQKMKIRYGVGLAFFGGGYDGYSTTLKQPIGTDTLISVYSEKYNSKTAVLLSGQLQLSRKISDLNWHIFANINFCQAFTPLKKRSESYSMDNISSTNMMTSYGSNLNASIGLRYTLGFKE